MNAGRQVLVEVDAEMCLGIGMCVSIARDRFALVDGTSRPPAGPVAADDALVGAAMSCPSEAIRLLDPTHGTEINAHDL